MAITINYDSFMDYVWSSDSMYKDEYKKLSGKAQEKLNGWFDGQQHDSSFVDDVWVDRIAFYTNKEMLVDNLDYLILDEFNDLNERDILEEFVNDNQEGIFYQCSNEFSDVLDVDIENDEWTVFY